MLTAKMPSLKDKIVAQAEKEASLALAAAKKEAEKPKKVEISKKTTKKK